MKIMTIFFLLFMLSSCGLYEKNEGGNEIVLLTEQVLKYKEGVSIEVKSIPQERK